MSGSIAIMLGLAPVAPSFQGAGAPTATYYILLEDSNNLSAEDGLILRTEQDTP